MKAFTEYGEPEFYVERKSEQSKDVEKVYAEADSSGTKTYFSFYPNRILKVKERENVIFTGVTQSERGSVHQEISSFDAMVFTKAVLLLDSLQLNWKSPGNIVAFIPEVLYYHGRPKNYKLKPL